MKMTPSAVCYPSYATPNILSKHGRRATAAVGVDAEASSIPRQLLATCYCCIAATILSSLVPETFGSDGQN